MSKPDRQKLSVLVVLLVVLGGIIAFGFRRGDPPTTAAGPSAGAKPSTNPPAPNDARIRLDLVEKPETSEEIGNRNLFLYQQAPPPPSSTQRGGAAATLSAAASPPPVPTPINRAPQTTGPPPIALKYQGFAATSTPNRALTAFLADDARHYNVTVGEVLMGRYRIVGITEKSVEVEDLEFNRRQVLPYVK